MGDCREMTCSQAISHYYSGEGPDIYKGYVIPPKSVVIPNVW